MAQCACPSSAPGDHLEVQSGTEGVKGPETPRELSLFSQAEAIQALFNEHVFSPNKLTEHLLAQLNQKGSICSHVMA